MSGSDGQPAADGASLRLACLIVTHAMPDHLGRLINALSGRLLRADTTDYYAGQGDVWTGT